MVNEKKEHLGNGDTHTCATRLGLETIVLSMTAFAAAFFHLDFARLPSPPATAPSAVWALSGTSAAGVVSCNDTGLGHLQAHDEEIATCGCTDLLHHGG